MKEKITVIDDDQDLRSLLQIALRIEGYEVLSFENGAEFMENLEKAEPSDVYIIDINLGGISGFELCQYLKSCKATCQSLIILISANPEVQQLSREAQADDHIVKPFSQKELLRRIARGLKKNDSDHKTGAAPASS